MNRTLEDTLHGCKALAAIALLAGASTVAFDAGYFCGLGQRSSSTFYLAERIDLAVRQIPFALIFSAGILLAGSVVARCRNPAGWPGALTAVLGLIAGSILVLALVKGIIANNYFLVIFLTPALLTVVLSFRLAAGTAPGVLHASVLILVCAWALAIGSLAAWARLAQSPVSEKIRMSTGEAVGGKILGSDAREILFWDPARQRLHVLSREKVRSVEDVRSPR